MDGYRRDVFDVLEWFKRHSGSVDMGFMNWSELPTKSISKLTEREAMKLLIDYTLPTHGARDALKNITFPFGHLLSGRQGKAFLLNDGSVLVVSADDEKCSNVEYHHFSPYDVSCQHEKFHESVLEDWQNGVPMSKHMLGYRTYVCDHCGYWWEIDSSD